MKTKVIITSICFLLLGLCIPKVTVSAEELQEYTEYLTEDEFRGIIEEAASQIFNNRSTVYNINWTIKKNTRRTTSMFYMSSGSVINVGVDLSITGKAGIIGADAVARYVQGTSLYKSFDISKSQVYCVYIQNDNSVNMTASGCYIK